MAAFLGIVVVWVAVDQLSKGFFSAMQPGGVIAGPYLGLVDVRLVHNTGGAWGIFSGNTMALGVFSVAVCVALAAYFFWQCKEMGLLQTVGFALVVSGGIGNAIDRFAQSYVVDFIEFAFMDFPVFNVADIGVTCGFAIIALSLLLQVRAERKAGR